jgi:thiol-disulfide isomerase/thioredoxin
MKIFLTIILLMNVTVVWSQKPTIVILHYKKSSFFGDSSILTISQPVNRENFIDLIYESRLISYTCKDSLCTSVTKYNIPDTVCAILRNGFGHESIIVPGDTIEIEINPNKVGKINNLYPSPWINEFTYLGSDKHVNGFFDSLAYVSGELRWSETPFSQAKFNIDTFYNIVYDKYRGRQLFIDFYCGKHNIPEGIKKIASAELKLSYINNLFLVLNSKTILKEKLPQYYKQAMDQVDNIPLEYYFKTTLFQTALYNSALYNNMTESMHALFSDSGFIAIYDYLKKKFTGDIRNNLVVKHFSRFMGSPNLHDSYDSLLADFTSLSNNEKHVSYIEKLIETKRTNIEKIITLNQAFSSVVSDRDNNRSTLTNVLSKEKLTLIDCWATWCGPCLRKIPLIKGAEKKYSSEVNFLYLSFDKNNAIWKSKLDTLKIGVNTFFLDNNFYSDFARYFKIISIPKYILVSASGQIIAIQTDNFNSSEQINSVLDKAIKTNSLKNKTY